MNVLLSWFVILQITTGRAMKKLNEVISDLELEDMEDSLSLVKNKVIELLNMEEIKSNWKITTILETMYVKISEANEALENFEYKLEKENDR